MAPEISYPNSFKKQKAKKLVAIVVPMANRAELTPDEEISMKHLNYYLAKYDKYLVVPKKLQIYRPGFRIKRFKDIYFGSAKAHNRLVLSTIFYKSFQEYKFILVYHLDALVFSDKLVQWCEANYDFIGAPWVKHKDAPYAGNPKFEEKVGNGGFSLRKIESFLKVLYSKNLYMNPSDYWQKYYNPKPLYERIFNIPKKYLKSFGIKNNVRTELSKFISSSLRNEEAFWVNRASHYYPNFNIPPVETALRFAFEVFPSHCYARNHNQLPFGCHAWQKYDRKFWEPFLLK